MIPTCSTVAAHVFQVRHVEHLSSGIFVYNSDILGVIFLSSTPWPVLENDADITTLRTWNRCNSKKIIHGFSSQGNSFFLIFNHSFLNLQSYYAGPVWSRFFAESVLRLESRFALLVTDRILVRIPEWFVKILIQYEVRCWDTFLSN
jgi:hypothetical protein